MKHVQDQPEMARTTEATTRTMSLAHAERALAGVSDDWTEGLPTLRGAGVTLRELRVGDAATLLQVLTTEEVTRFISPPPTEVAGFERFIAWTHRERAAGDYACFGVVPDGCDAAIGLFQLRTIGPGFGTAEWGFALGSTFWGSGAFEHGARLILDFAFDTLGVRRLEARAAVQNGRGNGALRKLGACQEGILRGSLLIPGQELDQSLWSLLDEDWRRVRRATVDDSLTRKLDSWSEDDLQRQ